MPKYVYRCSECNGEFITVHGMTERQDHCELCFSSACLRRIPQMTFIKTFADGTNNWKQDRHVGESVKEAISDNAEILKEMKREASKEYKDEN